MKCAVVVFPGSNFEDYFHVCKDVMGHKPNVFSQGQLFFK